MHNNAHAKRNFIVEVQASGWIGRLASSASRHLVARAFRRTAAARELDHGLHVGVVGDVTPERVAMHQPCGEKRFGGFELHVAGDDEVWRRSGHCAHDAALDCDALARIAEETLRHRHVRAEVVVDVEAAAGGVGVEDVEVDHLSRPSTGEFFIGSESYFAQPFAG